MVLKDGGNSGKGLFRGVDWTKTRAYAVGFNSIFLNLKGRENEGIVKPEQASYLKEELAKNLSTLKDDEIYVIDKISDAEKNGKLENLGNKPDLIAGYTKNYRCSWQSAIGGVGDNLVFEANKKKWSGDHCCNPIKVPGVIFSSEKLSADKISVLDIRDLVGSQIGK